MNCPRDSVLQQGVPAPRGDSYRSERPLSGYSDGEMRRQQREHDLSQHVERSAKHSFSVHAVLREEETWTLEPFDDLCVSPFRAGHGMCPCRVTNGFDEGSVLPGTLPEDGHLRRSRVGGDWNGRCRPTMVIRKPRSPSMQAPGAFMMFRGTGRSPVQRHIGASRRFFPEGSNLLGRVLRAMCYIGVRPFLSFGGSESRSPVSCSAGSDRLAVQVAVSMSVLFPPGKRPSATSGSGSSGDVERGRDSRRRP